MVLLEYKADVILNSQLYSVPITPLPLFRVFDIDYFNPKFNRANFKFMYLSYGNIYPGSSIHTILTGMFILEYMLTHHEFAISAHSF
jgi:hypothetical protein